MLSSPEGILKWTLLLRKGTYTAGLHWPLKMRAVSYPCIGMATVIVRRSLVATQLPNAIVR